MSPSFAAVLPHPPPPPLAPRIEAAFILGKPLPNTPPPAAAAAAGLAPVREIFDSNSLNFDEIMQRDIDDARVSSKLIPYILEESASDRIKFFPPIVVVLLPLEDGGQKKPGKVYPEVTESREKGSEEDQANNIEAWWAVQSGTVGEEVFKFKQPMVNEKPLSHDLCQLSVNTKKHLDLKKSF